MKFKFKHSYQISALQLSRQKNYGKCALCAPCALLCTTVHPCTPVFSKMWFIRKLMKFKFKHPYQISELQHNRQKSQGKCALCVHPVRPCAPLHICFFKIWFIRKLMKFKFKHSYQISALQLNKQKSCGKCAPVHPCAPLCTPVHPCTVQVALHDLAQVVPLPSGAHNPILRKIPSQGLKLRFGYPP